MLSNCNNPNNPNNPNNAKNHKLLVNVNEKAWTSLEEKEKKTMKKRSLHMKSWVKKTNERELCE